MALWKYSCQNIILISQILKWWSSKICFVKNYVWHNSFAKKREHLGVSDNGKNWPCANDDAEHEPIAEQRDHHDQAIDAHHKVVPRGEVILDTKDNNKNNNNQDLYLYLYLEVLTRNSLQKKTWSRSPPFAILHHIVHNFTQFSTFTLSQVLTWKSLQKISWSRSPSTPLSASSPSTPALDPPPPSQLDDLKMEILFLLPGMCRIWYKKNKFFRYQQN